MNSALAEHNQGFTENDAGQPLIEARGVSVVFQHHQVVLSDISVSIDRGQTVAIIGESGCGKTVFMKTLVGLIKPTSGMILFDGQVIGEMTQGELTQHPFVGDGGEPDVGLTRNQPLSAPETHRWLQFRYDMHTGHPAITPMLSEVRVISEQANTLIGY